MLDLLIKRKGFWINFNSWNLYILLVLQWWFHNKLSFGDFGGLATLRGYVVVFLAF
jgi:hypothetical protein